MEESKTILNLKIQKINFEVSIYIYTCKKSESLVILKHLNTTAKLSLI